MSVVYFAVTRPETDAVCARKQIRVANYLNVAGLICGVVMITLAVTIYEIIDYY